MNNVNMISKYYVEHANLTGSRKHIAWRPQVGFVLSFCQRVGRSTFIFLKKHYVLICIVKNKP